MSMVVRSNMNAMNANRNLSMNNGQVAKSLEKLASGYAINRAGDDASGLAISEKMKAQIKGLEQASSNSQDGISLVQTAEGAMTEIHSMLNRMVELATKSANGTIQDEVDRDAIQTEVDALRSEVDRIADATNFNGIDLLNGNLSSDYTVIKDSTTATQAVTLDVGINSSGLTYGNVTTDAFLVKTEANTSKGSFDTMSAITSQLDSTDGSGSIIVEYEVSGQIQTVEAQIDWNSGDFTVQIGDDKYDSTAFSQITTTTQADYVKLVQAVEKQLVESVTNTNTGTEWETGINADAFANDKGETVTIKSITGTDGLEAAYTTETFALDTATQAIITNNVSVANINGTVFTVSYQDANGQEQNVNLTFSGNSTDGFSAKLDDGTELEVYGSLAKTAGGADIQDWVNSAVNELLVSNLGIDAGAGKTLGSSETGNVIKNLSFSHTNPANTDVGDDFNGNWKANTGDLDKLTLVAAKLETGEVGITDIATGASFEIDGLTYKLDNTVYGTSGDGSTESPIVANDIGKLVDEINANLAEVGKDMTVRLGEDGTSIVWQEKELEITTETVVSTGAALTLQVGDTYDQFNNVSVEIESMKCNSLGIDSISVSDQESAGAAIDTINSAINMVSTNRAELGALQNRLEYTINNLDNTAENMTSANSAIRDTDMASEMMEYTKMNVLVQSAQSMLAQANQAPQQILSLLG